MIPASKPRATRALIETLARSAWEKANGAAPMPAFYLVGVRAYYRDSMGEPGKNDRAIYDDALFVIGAETFAAFNANTDPSQYKKGIASLAPGVHLYKKGNHGISRPGGGYPAFRPATKDEALPVSRDGEPGLSSQDGIAINIHRGGNYTTSSAGCQTLPPKQWESFYALTCKELAAAGQKTFPYILLKGSIS
jgi:lysozyme